MNEQKDFEIKNGNRLVKYHGPGGDVVIPDGVYEIANEAFSGREDITSVVIPESVREIRPKAFFGCASLKQVQFPEKLSYIYEAAFQGCVALQQVTIPAGCSYDASCFSGCSSLTEFYSLDGNIQLEDLPSLTTVRLPGQLRGGRIFIANCPNLRQFLVDPNNPYYTTEDGILYSKDKKVLYAYPSASGRVTIPSGVEQIGAVAFCKNTALAHLIIPETVKAICDISLYTSSCTFLNYKKGSAFAGCTNLAEFKVLDGNDSFSSNGPMLFDQSGKELISWPSASGNITFPEELQSIGPCALEKNTQITEILIPRNITSIGYSSFRQCTALAQVRILAPDVQFEVDTFIGGATFNDCGSLKHVELPESLSFCPDFQNCTSLEEFTVPSKVSDLNLYRCFKGCTSLKTVWIPETIKNIYGWGHNFDIRPDLLSTSKKLPVGLTPLLRHGGNAQDVAYILFYQAAKAWETEVDEYLGERPDLVDDVVRALTSLLSGKKKPNAAAEQRIADFILERQAGASAETLRSFYQICEEKKSNILKILEKDTIFLTHIGILKKTDAEEDALPPLERLVQSNWKVTPEVKQLQSGVKEGIHYADGQGVSSPEAVIFVIASYSGVTVKMTSDAFTTNGREGEAVLEFPKTAEEVARGLDRSELTTLLENLLYKDKEVEISKEILIPALCRFGSEEQVQELILQKKRHRWGYKATGQKNEKLIDKNLYLSDTKAAMRNCDLTLYAKTRGTDTETLRDTVLSALDLDENGKKRYDLGGRLVEASLTGDMKISLYDVTAAKAVKSIPKKNADPAFYEEAKKNLSDLKKEIKTVYTERKNLLLQDFLSGREKKAESWKMLCRLNPLIRQLFSLLVWEQSGTTFTLKDGCAVNSSGNPCDIDSEGIRIAHPMEMKPEDLKAWQTYFVSNGYKQPFAQIWEPIYSPQDVKPDRYQGCVIPLDQFRRQEKHGIYLDALNLTIDFKDCEVEYTFSGPPQNFMVLASEVTITSFRFKEYNRQVNHIVGRLDGWTISQRIEKDDVSAVAMLQGATLAQVTEYLNIAMEHNCANCTAALLEYKANHFADFDPMKEFMLE